MDDKHPYLCFLHVFPLEFALQSDPLKVVSDELLVRRVLHQVEVIHSRAEPKLVRSLSDLWDGRLRKVRGWSFLTQQ